MSEKEHILCSSDGKESACNSGDLDWIPESGRSLGERSLTEDSLQPQPTAWSRKESETQRSK